MLQYAFVLLYPFPCYRACVCFLRSCGPPGTAGPSRGRPCTHRPRARERERGRNLEWRFVVFVVVLVSPPFCLCVNCRIVVSVLLLSCCRAFPVLPTDHAGSPASREKGRESDREKERESERETSACLPSLALPCLALLPLLPYCCTVVPSSLCVCLPFSCPLSSPSFYAEGGKYGARTRSSSKFWEVTSDDVPLPA